MTEFLSTTEAAKILGISRIAVFKKIQSGEIKAKKVGRNYVIDEDDLGAIFRTRITPTGKKEIDRAIKKTIKEYGEVLRKLKDE